MAVSVQVPRSMVHLVPRLDGEVAQNDSLVWHPRFRNGRIIPHLDLPIGRIRSKRIPQTIRSMVVITANQVDLTIEMTQKILAHSSVSKSEITKVVNRIRGSYATIPDANQSVIHSIDVTIEGPPPSSHHAVTKVSVGGKPDRGPRCHGF